MFASRTALRALDDRLDAEFYHPSFIQNEVKLHNSGIKLATLRDVATKLKCGPFGSSLHSDAYVADGIPFVHPTCFSSGWLDIHKAEKISAEDHERLKSTQFHGPALVFARVGTPCCGVVPEMLHTFNIHGDVIGLQCKPNHDSHFVYSYFQSAVGKIELLRYQAGSTRPRTNTDILGTVLALEPNPITQRYIGNKIRQAECLREVSLGSMRLAQQLIEALISKSMSEDDLRTVIPRTDDRNAGPTLSITLPSASDRASTSGHGFTSRISGIGLAQRLDAAYYQREFLENEAAILTCGLPLNSIGSLSEKCNCGATPKEVVYGGVGQGLIRTTDVRPNVFLADRVLRTSDIKVSPTSAVAAITNDIVYTMSGTIGYAAVIPDETEVFSFSNTIARARLPKDSNHDPHYIAGFFNSRFGYKQSLRLTSGGIQGHVMPNPFKGLLVPTPSPNVQKFIGDLFRKADRLERYAGRLVAASKELVTAFIENHISEADLQDAQRCLEKGDREQDRAILSRLSANGIDVAGSSPLFPDAEALYAAIDAFCRDDPSNGDDA
jgi:type I restriction enzyme S subunit